MNTTDVGGSNWPPIITSPWRLSTPIALSLSLYIYISFCAIKSDGLKSNLCRNRLGTGNLWRDPSFYSINCFKNRSYDFRKKKLCFFM